MITLSDLSHPTDPRGVEQLRPHLETLMKRSDLGFAKIPDRDSIWSQVSSCAERLLNQYQHFVFVGIGGSGLGGRTVAGAFQRQQSVHFLENVDQQSLEILYEKIEAKNTAFILTSKSGGTLETLALANGLEAKLHSDGLSLNDRSVVITESKKSPLMNWAEQVGAEQLEIPLDVGGRFSVLTAVGLLPAALLGVDINDLRQGALWARNQDQLILDLSSQIQQSFERKEWITQFWVYSDPLATFGLWLQQLWAESLAKKETRDGASAPRVSTPMACTGAIDQHSVLQQVAEGERDKFLMFFQIAGIEDSPVPNIFPDLEHLEGNGLQRVLEAEAEATLRALGQAGVSHCRLRLDHLNGKTLGAAFMLFEIVIGVLGEAHNIDAFNQPGVEQGKVLAKRILSAK